MKYIPQEIKEYFSFWLNTIYNDLEIGWCFTIIALIIFIFAFIQLITHIRYSRWDGGIDKKAQNELQIHHPFDPSKGILYVARRLVGFWESYDKIHQCQNEYSNKLVLNSLAQRYNLILYIPEQDKNTKIYVSNLEPSIKFIVDNDFPICYITQHMPPRNKVKPFSCNDGNLWFIEYKKEMKSLKWKEYM